MNALRDQFVTEARELIQQANDDLVAAEQGGFTDARIERVFRAFHTLKGAAGVVDLPDMGFLLHAAEDVLAAIQAGRVAPTAALIDQLLVSLDQVGRWVDEFDVNETLPADSSDDARTIVDALQMSIGMTPATARAGAPEADAVPEWVATLIATRRAPLDFAPASPHVAFSYQPRAGCFFDGDDPIELMRRVPKLKAVRIRSLAGAQTLEEFDPFTCNLLLEGISAATRAELAGVFRLVPDQVSFVEVPASALPQSLTAGAPEDDAAALARIVIQEQADVLRTSGDPETLKGRIGSAVRATVAALRYAHRPEMMDSIERAAVGATARSSIEPLLQAIKDAVRLLAADAGSSEPADANASASRAVSRTAARSLRVDETRIDALVDLAGELLVATHGVADLAWRVKEGEADRDLARTVTERKDALERIAGEMHAAVLRLRMVPVAQVFRTFPRIVRDLSQQLGKNVALVTRGETTEADKTIVDLMFEPLMHLVRNALDHGMETPEQRQAAGKTEAATLTLQARRQGDRLVVDVIDNGRGIDPAMIREKAIERRLLPGDELAALSDEQATSLIFAAGFSTASEISDISGRGVGMDVVRETIERIGGRISLKSDVGIGTQVSLDFPMNIALLRIMVVETAGQLLGIPMDAVLETVRLAPDRISRIKHNEGFVLHGRVVPVCSLAELLNLPAAAPVQGDRLFVVAEIGGRTTALEVDAIRERLEVVLKPMQGLLSNARGYAGTTLLGDGAVLLVLDLREFLT